MLKKQALAYLAKNNWGNAISGFFIMLIPFLVILLGEGTIVTLVSLFINIEAENIINAVITLGIEFLTLSGLVLVTPVFSGYQRMCYHISKGQNAEISDVLYYFKKGFYGKCLGMNINIMGRIIGFFCLLSLPAVIYFVTFKIKFLVAIIIAYLVIVTVLTFFFAMRYTVVPCVLFEDERLSSFDIVKIGRKIARPHLGTINMLTLSFFPYYLLCFFVVPWIFVAPYVIVAYMTNGKWITQLYLNKEN